LDRGGVRKILRETVARLITDVSTGKLNPRIPTGPVPLLGLQLRTIEIADLDVQLRKLDGSLEARSLRRHKAYR
jgi:hypothetical protein